MVSGLPNLPIQSFPLQAPQIPHQTMRHNSKRAWSRLLTRKRAQSYIYLKFRPPRGLPMMVESHAHDAKQQSFSKWRVNLIWVLHITHSRSVPTCHKARLSEEMIISRQIRQAPTLTFGGMLAVQIWFQS